MSTVAEIITYVDRKYPNNETDANKIIDLNTIQTEVYLKLGRLKNDYSIDQSTQTVADQLAYDLPTDCRPENILAVHVSDSSTISTSTVWTEYKFGKETIGTWWYNYPNDKIALISDDLPITTDDLYIRIQYFPRPSTLTATTETPDLDTDYHDILKYRLISELASQGSTPDANVANFWQSKADEMLETIEESLDRYTQESQVEEYW